MNKSQVSGSASSAIYFSFSQGTTSEESNRATDPTFLSAELIAFIAEEIASIEQLEILLCLFRNDRWWNAVEVYDVVKSSLTSVQERLKLFTSQGVLEKDESDPPRYRYNGMDKKRAQVMAELDTQYRDRRVRIIELIYSQRHSGATEFARAFRIRKENN